MKMGFVFAIFSVLSTLKYFLWRGENDISMRFVRNLYECFWNWQLIFAIERNFFLGN